MARSKNTNGTAQAPRRFDDITFVVMRLGEAEKKQFKSWFSAKENAWFTRLSEIVQDGYKLSLSYWFDGACYIGTLTCKEPKDPNHNRAMSSRSDDPAEALALCVFKHDHLCNDNIWEAEANDQNWG
jgi:hypothetical protein